MFVATEIRCQEKSKGGLAYEVILAEPVTVTPPKRPPSPNSKVSAENIEEKLKAAEERRLVSFKNISHLLNKLNNNNYNNLKGFRIIFTLNIQRSYIYLINHIHIF